MSRPDVYEIVEYMTLEEKEKLLKHLQLVIEYEKHAPNQSFLEEAWEEIERQMYDLSYERYIDDQVQIDEIWKICGQLVQSGKLKDEPWDLRKRILAEIIEGQFFAHYGVYDPMEELFAALCTTPEEKLESADLAFRFGSGFMKSKCAKLYLECGQPEKYYAYLETTLGREEAPYVELIRYYEERDPEKAMQFALQGWAKCRDSQTDLAIFLIREAQAREDLTAAEKILRSARLRRAVDFDRVQAAVQSGNQETEKEC
ncbi:MAG: hypothetical protein IJ210_03060 [Clostridia bacterium]|nr:hypothetical protein [Clostridia bacterium]